MDIVPAITVPAGRRPIPVYDLRDLDQRAALAAALAAGQVAAFYSGLFCLLKGFPAPQEPVRHAAVWDQAPLWMSPREAVALLDRARIHPAFRLPEAFVRLYTALPAPLQVAAPLRNTSRQERARCSVLLTAGEDDGGLGDPAGATGSFLWMHDLAWTALADLLDLSSAPGTRYRLGPLPFPRERPPYTLAELARQTQVHRVAPFDLVIRDSRYEQTGALCGQTQVRVPLRDEAPELVLLQHGCVSAAWLAEASGWPVRVPAAARPARCAPGLSDDDLRLHLDRSWQ